MPLFQPAWQGKDVVRAVRSVEQLHDQKLLTDIAAGKGLSTALTYQNKERVARAAVGRLTDPALLEVVARHGFSQLTRSDAQRRLEGLGDGDPLTVVKESQFPVKRSQALQAITSQEDLLDVARHAQDWGIRLAAARRVQDQDLAQALFMEIARCPDYEVALQAVDRISDHAQAELAYVDLVKWASTKWTSRSATWLDQTLERVTSQSALAEIASSAELPMLRIRAAMRLSDKDAALQALGEGKPVYFFDRSGSTHMWNKDLRSLLETLKKDPLLEPKLDAF